MSSLQSSLSPSLFRILFLYVSVLGFISLCNENVASRSNTAVNVPSYPLVRLSESDHAEYHCPYLAKEIFPCFPGLVSLAAENNLLAHDCVS